MPAPGRPIRSVLVANRGEIAVRIIRACRELGIESIQAYTEADRDSLAVRLADRSICIGHARSSDSYLNAPLLVSAALSYGAEAIHPGCGFLSEDADFASLCEANGVRFIGPSAEAIRKMGDKAMARKLAQEAGVPISPGSKGKVADAAEALEVAARIGYPIIIKASAGGGGRGIRVVQDAKKLENALGEVAREAKAAFGDDAIYVEKYFTCIRHIEIQVIGDGSKILTLGERDCSIQRRNQKLVEESPSPVLGEAMRARISEAAVRLCAHVGYSSAGTIECMLDEESGEFYFMEMNTRIQVEHPITEMTTGFDLVKAQISIAGGAPLEIEQSDIKQAGHAIECRINAEDVEREFMPCPGLITRYHAPGGPGVRVDSHVFSGYTVPLYYDSLLAKVVCWGRDREESLARMSRALREMVVDGVKTTIPFHSRLLGHERFRNGDFQTSFVENELLPWRT